MQLQVQQILLVSAAHDGQDTTGYELYVNGDSVETKPVSELKDGRISFEYQADKPGVLELKIAAYRDPEFSDVKTVTIG